MPGLIVRYDGSETVVPEGEVVVIGATADARVHIPKPGISRHHARVRFDGSRWMLEDTDSRNGTYVAGSRIDEMAIGARTAVRLGHPVEGELVELDPQPSRPEDPVTVPARFDAPAQVAPQDAVVALLAGQQRLLAAVWALVAAVVLLAVVVAIVAIAA